MKIHISCWQIHHIWRFIFLLYLEQAQYESLPLSHHPVADSRYCINSMLCCHPKCRRFHPYLIHSQKLFAGAHIFIKVFSTTFALHQELVTVSNDVNVTSFCPVHLAQIDPIPFGVHWLILTSNLNIHI